MLLHKSIFIKRMFPLMFLELGTGEVWKNLKAFHNLTKPKHEHTSLENILTVDPMETGDEKP